MEKKKFRVSGERLAILGLLIALTFTLSGFAIASAVVSNSDGTVNGCYSPKNGKLRVAISACKAGKENPIQLSGETPMFARVNANGTLGAQKHAVSSSQPIAGVYVLTFDQDVSNCAYAATAIDTSVSREIVAFPGPDGGGSNTQVAVVTSNSSGAQVSERFSLTVTC